MSKITELAAGQLPNSTGDLIVVLNEPDGGIPASVVIHWPAKPTTIDPARFGDLARTVVLVFRESHVALARIRSRRHLP